MRLLVPSLAKLAYQEIKRTGIYTGLNEFYEIEKQIVEDEKW